MKKCMRKYKKCSIYTYLHFPISVDATQRVLGCDASGDWVFLSLKLKKKNVIFFNNEL